MRTVQEWLQEMNTEKLIDTFLAEFPIRLDKLMKRDVNVRKYYYDYRIMLREGIEKLRNVPLEDMGYHGLIFVHPFMEDGLLDHTAEVLHVEDLLEGKYILYGYGVCSPGEIMGFRVADTQMTLNHLEKMMVEVLYTGYFSKEKAVRENEEDYVPRDYGIDPIEEAEGAARKKVVDAQWKFEEQMLDKELELIRSMLIKTA